MANQPGLKQMFIKKDPNTTKRAIDLTLMIVEWFEASMISLNKLQDSSMFSSPNLYLRFVNDISFLTKCIVEFLRIMDKLAPWYQVPSKSYVAYQVLPAMVMRIRTEMRVAISEADKIHFIADGWTSSATDSCILLFLSFAFHPPPPPPSLII